MDTHNCWQSNDKNCLWLLSFWQGGSFWLLEKAGSKVWQEWTAKCPHNAPSSGMWHPLLHLLSSLLPIGGRTCGRGVARAPGSRDGSPGGTDLCLWSWGGLLGEVKEGGGEEVRLHPRGLGHSWLCPQWSTKEKIHLCWGDLILLISILSPAPQILGTAENISTEDASNSHQV